METAKAHLEILTSWDDMLALEKERVDATSFVTNCMAEKIETNLLIAEPGEPVLVGASGLQSDTCW